MTTDRTLPAPPPQAPPRHIRAVPSDVPPPARYPLEDWAPAGSPYHVPEHLRGYYAAARIPASIEAQYLAEGGTLELVRVHDHDDAMARAEAAGRLRGGVLLRPGALLVDPLDTLEEYGPTADRRYRVNQWRRIPPEEGMQAWRHALRMQQATAGYQANLDDRRRWTATLCRTCGQYAGPQLREGGLGYVCDGCFDLYQRLKIEQELIGGHTRLERVQAWLTETTAPVAAPAQPTPIAAGEKPQRTAAKRPARSTIAVAS